MTHIDLDTIRERYAMARTRNVLAEPAKGHSRKWRRGGWVDAR